MLLNIITIPTRAATISAPTIKTRLSEVVQTIPTTQQQSVN